MPLLHELWRSGAAAAEAAGVDADADADADAAGATGAVAGGAVRRVAMSRSEQRAVDVMQPAHRNMNGFMFGGYLMRRALEVTPPNQPPLSDHSPSPGGMAQRVPLTTYLHTTYNLPPGGMAQRLPLRTSAAHLRRPRRRRLQEARRGGGR